YRKQDLSCFINGDNSVSLHWKLDYRTDAVIFEVHLPFGYGWFAIGFSDRGQPFPADYCLMWENQRNKLLLHDGTTYIVWARGKQKLYKVNGVNISSPAGDNGMVRVHLLKNANANTDLPPYVKTLDILTNKVAALPIGGEKFNPYIMLEVHYNNPEHLKGIVDSSGIRFHTSENLRKMDAGVIELGLEYTDKMAIPPRQELFPLTGYCTSACTTMGLPPEGITIFGSQLHTHLTGIRVYTRHFDAYGKELPELNRDNHFSTHFQEIRRLKKPVKVLPGQVLITRCDYNTEDRENITLGGFGISDEMCVNYIHYYPHTVLEVCKSSISDQALQTYFRYMHEWEGQPTSPSKGVSDNYKAINWNKMRVQLLSEVYNEAPLSMQCNMSSGDRFPGYWENAHIPPILQSLAPPSRKCENIDYGYM
ncbi:hypothetical protein NQ317_016690, partial [Molorchus minor]